MNQTLQKILDSRPDLSDYLFHFTKGAKAKDDLKKIIGSRELKDIKKTGFICFTEAPLLMLDNMFKIFDPFDEPMYARYGIAISKKHLFDAGARPVIYGSLDEKNHFADEIRWRFEELKPNVKDFSWLREWRLNTEILQIDPNHSFLIVSASKELDEFVADWESIGEIEFDGCVDDGRFWGTAYFTVERDFQGVSFEQLRELNSISAKELKKLLSNQKLGDTIGRRDLGSI